MKKKYFSIQFEISLLDKDDVISTSGQEDIAPDNNHQTPFEGSFDEFGWT